MPRTTQKNKTFAGPMKHNSHSLWSVLLLSASVALTPLALGADGAGERPAAQQGERQGRGPGAAPGQRGQRMNVDEQIKQLAADLNLTEDQKTKLKPILQEQLDKSQKLRQDEALPREQRQEKMREIREATNAKIKAVLTADQYEKWQKQRQERMQRGPQGQGGPQRQGRQQGQGGGGQ